MFGLNTWEWLIILVVLLLLFGQKLPSVMRSMGRSVTEFKKGMNDIGDEAAFPAKKEESDPNNPDSKPAG